jgi:hypothetical protein
LLEISSTDFIDAIDEFIQFAVGKHGFGEFKLPKWMTELMARLLSINLAENVLDIYSNFGDSVATINRLDKNAKVISATSHNSSYLWDKVKRLVLGLSPNDVFYTPKIFIDEQKGTIKQLSDIYDKILVAPPFGGRPSSSEPTRFRKSEEIFIDLSLELVKPSGRIVSIVPENLLFSSTSSAFRDYIIESTWVRAIISLEQFLPNSGVKASIIVLDRKSPDSPGGNILMSRITRKDVEVLSDPNLSLLDSNRIKKLLAIYESHIQNNAPQEEKTVWFTSEDKLENQSWSVDYYDPSNQIDTKAEFPLFPLRELVSLRKGSPLTVDKHGSLPVIGPGALRSFSIDSAKLDKTTEEKLPKKPVISQINDILIHGVGTYRGQAALVEPGFENCFISRNVIVLRNVASIVLPAYLVIALNSNFVRKQLKDKATGSVYAQFSVEKLRDLQIPVPDLGKQKSLVEKVSSTRQKLLEFEQQALIVQSARKEQQTNLQAILDNVHLGGGENA